MSEYPASGHTSPRLEDLDPTGTLFEAEEVHDTSEADAEAYQDRRLHEQADKLGSYDLARESLGIEVEGDEDRPRRAPGAIAAKAELVGKHTDRRGGRSYEEPSDGDLDPNNKRTVDYLDDEQITLNNENIAALRAEFPSARQKAKEEYLAECDKIRATEDRANWSRLLDGARRAYHVKIRTINEKEQARKSA